MAPRALESRQDFLERLRAQAAAGAREVRFGGHHHTHAACSEDGESWTIRRLILPEGAAEAYLAEHGIFMPEHAEMISVPGPVVTEAESLDELAAWLVERPWPL